MSQYCCFQPFIPVISCISSESHIIIDRDRSSKYCATDLIPNFLRAVICVFMCSESYQKLSFPQYYCYPKLRTI